VPDALRRLIGRALAKRPDDRFDDAAAMATALAKAVATPEPAAAVARDSEVSVEDVPQSDVSSLPTTMPLVEATTQQTFGETTRSAVLKPRARRGLSWKSAAVVTVAAVTAAWWLSGLHVEPKEAGSAGDSVSSARDRSRAAQARAATAGGIRDAATVPDSGLEAGVEEADALVMPVIDVRDKRPHARPGAEPRAASPVEKRAAPPGAGRPRPPASSPPSAPARGAAPRHHVEKKPATYKFKRL